MIATTWALFLLAGSLLPFRLTPYLHGPKPVEIRIETQEDYDLLEKFFKMGCSDEEYGYVLEGAKPISIRHFYSLAHFPSFKDVEHGRKEFAKTLLVHKALALWNRICPGQKRIALKAVPLSDSKSATSEIELRFINISALKKTIEEHIDLFYYILGPFVKTEELVNRIVRSSERLSAILNNSRILEGIVLGFGSHNSVIGGRLEEIYARTISKDTPPFLPKSSAMYYSQSPVAPEAFGYYFLEYAGGDDSFFRTPFPDLNFGKLSCQQEMLTAQAMEEPLPPSLYQEPPFIFGAFKGSGSNKPFFRRLIKAQKEIQSLLKSPHFLEKVLIKIGGKKPSLSFKKNKKLLNQYITYLLPSEWITILTEASLQFEDPAAQRSFIDSFSNPSPVTRTPPKIGGVTSAMLRGLQKALLNLSEAERYFLELSKNKNLKVVIPNRLYVQTVAEGNGEKLEESDHVHISYIIQDIKGGTLFANCDQWLNLSEGIPGLAYGVQGMSLKEKRTLFIHPSLAYGAFTTLPPCAGLIIQVELLDFDREREGMSLSPPTLDLSWVQNISLYNDLEESIRQKPRYLGSFYRDLVEEIPEPDRKKVIKGFLSASLSPDSIDM